MLSKDNKLSWISLISFNDTWSVFGFRPKNEADKKKAAHPKEREIFKWINAETKTIKLPDYFATVIEKDEKAAGFFQSLSFTNRKEYLEWIVTAKRPETRAERITRSIDRLRNGWKNPRNK